MSIVIKCQKCEAENVIENAQEPSKCKSCRSYLVIQNTNEAASLSQVEKIKQQKALTEALVKNTGLEQADKDLLNASLGLIALQSGSYMIAQTHFKKIIDENPSNGEAYYYYSLSLLNGLRPFLNNREQIDHIIQNLNFAISVGFKGKYAYLKALAINDFYNMKSIRYPETYQSCLEMAAALGVTEEEKAEIFTLLKFKKPTNF